MRGRIFAVALLALAHAGPMFAAGPSQATSVRKGVVELSGDEVAALVASTVEDVRYDALQRVAMERRLRLDPSQAKGLLFPEGYQVVFVPAFNERNAESGFLANSEESWTLSLDVSSEKGRLVEGFAAYMSGSRAVVEAHIKPKPTQDQHAEGGVVALGTYSTACQYVSSYGINFGCWSLPDNPFGYYYTNVYRYGHTTDPYSQWWGCWQGSIHVCPQVEDPGSPYTWPTCGYPPSHPQG